MERIVDSSVETEKECRFRRVAKVRTQKVLDDLRLLAKCAEKQNYYYSQDDVEKILSAIEKELQVVRDRFSGKKRFTLRDQSENMHEFSEDFSKEDLAYKPLNEQIQLASNKATSVAKSVLAMEAERN